MQYILRSQNEILFLLKESHMIPLMVLTKKPTRMFIVLFIQEKKPKSNSKLLDYVLKTFEFF